MPVDIWYPGGIYERNVKPTPEPCKEAMIRRGLHSEPPEVFQVVWDGRRRADDPWNGRNVDNELMTEFDGCELAIQPPGRPFDWREPKRPEAFALVLIAGRRELTMNITTVIGRQVLKNMDPERGDWKFFDEKQMRFVREGQRWYLEPLPNARNATMLNGRRCAGRAELHDGDVVGVGNPAKGIVKLPMRVELRKSG